MINHVYRLIEPQVFEEFFTQVDISKNTVIIKPKYLSICAADMRYYRGDREKSILQEKLPMALIHEGIGTVSFDPSGEFQRGSWVVLIPLIEETSDGIRANYHPNSIFLSSGHDGFMQSVVALPKKQIISIPTLKPEEMISFVLLELMSVALGALSDMARHSSRPPQRFAVWGDGAMGYITALCLRFTYPNSHITVIGKNTDKLNYFSLVNETYHISSVPQSFQADSCFECVGGIKSELAIAQIIDCSVPQGFISLMGVSEYSISINTRKMLEKGLIINGASRSTREDFISALNLIHKNPMLPHYLNMIISQIVPINHIDDISFAFKNDITAPFKTILEWNI